jgi:hypothetical protein
LGLAKLVEQKRGKSAIENVVIALIWGAYNLNITLDPDIKANLSEDESENIRGINHSLFMKSNKLSITFYDPK